MKSWLGGLFQSWTWKMAWRDSRASRRRLALFSVSIVLGVAALTAIGSFGHSMEQAVDDQARTLLGADLVIASRQPFSAEEEAFFRALGGEQSRQISFSSMILFTASDGSRLVQVRGVSGGFPYYGKLETAPPAAASEFRSMGGALVEESLLIQYGAKVGDPIRIGHLNTRVAGSLLKVPGETVLLSTIAPRVYLSLSDLEKTRLLRPESLAAYRNFFRFDPGVNVPRLAKKIRPQTDRFRLRIGTVEERKEDLGKSMANLDNFLNLAAFVALLLGGVGVGSAIHVHIKQKNQTVAILRCLGASVPQTFAVYLAQAAGLGLAGSLTGATIGLMMQKIIPRIVADFIPMTIPLHTSWLAVGQAIGIGFIICVLFALLPLMAVRRFSPLTAIRVAYEPSDTRKREPALWLIGGLIAAGIIGFSLAHSRTWLQGLAFAGGLGVAFGLLFAVAALLVRATRRVQFSWFPYVWRQGLANLHRPGNRTVLMVLSIGLGTFMILTLYVLKETLLTELVANRPGSQANAVLFDIQPEQLQPVRHLLRAQGLPILDEAPIVTMRLSSVKGRTVEELLADRKSSLPGWALRREYRSTYGSSLRSGERLIAGRLQPQVPPNTDPVPVSAEEGIARELRVGLGDELIFDVQGVPVRTRITSLRTVDWRRVQPNFFVLFPLGALEEAPSFHVLTTRVASSTQSAALQRSVVKEFPNVSTIDLTLILQTLDAILSKITFVVRFMAAFTVVTGLLVVAGAILTGRYQRIQESVLLRTLGASGRQVLQILLAEYLCLGTLAALTGILLSVAAAWALARFMFDVPFGWPVLPLLVAWLVVITLTVLTGLLSSRGVLRHPPLAVLQAAG